MASRQVAGTLPFLNPSLGGARRAGDRARSAPQTRLPVYKDERVVHRLKPTSAAGGQAVAKGSRTRMSRAEQMERFLETAQALGCDPSEDLFGEIVRAIALARPEPPPTAPAAQSTKHARPRRVSAEGARPVKDAKSTKRNAERTNHAGLKGATARHTTTKSWSPSKGRRRQGATRKEAQSRKRTRPPRRSGRRKARRRQEAIGSEADGRRKGCDAHDRAGENRERTSHT